MKISKEKIIIIIVAGMLTLGIIIALVLCNNSKQDTAQEEVSNSNRTLYSHQLIDIENLNTSLYESKKITNFTIASKYPQVKEVYTIDANVDMYLEDNHKGKALYVRDGNTKLNILQFRYEINQSEENPEVIQLDEIIDNFLLRCASEIGIEDLDIERESTTSNGQKVPISEKVFFYKELHSINYKVKENPIEEADDTSDEAYIENEEKNYDVNFYIENDNTLVCELVRIL